MSIDQVIQVIEANEHIYEILKNCPYRILKKWSLQTYHRGEIIIHQGEPLTYFYIIVSGRADIYMMSENGKKYSQAIYKQADFIGEIEIFDQSPSVCFVEAKTAMKVLQIDVEAFLEWIQVDTHMSYYFNQKLAKYLFNLSEKAGTNSLYPLRYRLCNYLLKEAVPYKHHLWVVKNNRTKISHQLAVTQRSVNRLLQEWKEKKLLEIETDYIILLDKQRLQEEIASSMYD